MAVIEQHPYIDDEGVEDYGLVKHYSDEGKPIIQTETGIEFEEAVDVFPCRYHYVEKEEPEPAEEAE